MDDQQEKKNLVKINFNSESQKCFLQKNRIITENGKRSYRVSVQSLRCEQA